VVPQGQQGGHVGAAGYYGGWVYVPVQNPFGVWKVSADLTRSNWMPVSTTDNRLSWCAVNPLNGRLYTSMFDVSGEAVLYAYDRNTMERRPEDDITINAGACGLNHVQGGVFTERGRVILSTSDPNGVFVFSARTGYCFGSQMLGDYGSTDSEVEAVTVRPWVFGNTPAHVHILELDNDFPDKDDCYLHSYWVPQPQLL
jgi:hypothetical protein